MSMERALRSRARVVRTMGSLSIGIFAAYLCALVLAGDSFGRCLGGVPLGLWLALAAIIGSFLVVVAFALVSTSKLDPELRRLRGDR